MLSDQVSKNGHRNSYQYHTTIFAHFTEGKTNDIHPAKPGRDIHSHVATLK